MGYDSIMNNVGRVVTPLVLGFVYGRKLGSFRNRTSSVKATDPGLSLAWPQPDASPRSKFLCFLVGGFASVLVTQLLRRVRTERART